MSRAVSSTSWSRRGLLVGATAGLGLGGCGFRPLYGPIAAPYGGAGGEDIRTELAAIRVGLIPERFGQLLRRDLQRRFEGTAPGTAARYLLTVGVGISAEVLGYRRDGTISRVRYTATGTWNLATQSVPPQLVARNPLPFRTIDSFNVPDLQFFAADAARDAMEGRLVEVLGEEIFREVAIALRNRRQEAAAAAAAWPAPRGGGRGSPGPASAEG
jgi:LPS-assembly lipoprotein